MLSAQLQQSSSLNAVLLKNHKFQESYLFTPQQARLHDLDAVFQLAQNGLHLLATSSKQLKSLNSPLFAPSAKFTDRTRISVEENAVLDAAIEKLLYAISPFLMEQAASKIVEWLVRRYRVNEFNVDALLMVFLPYHSTPHFVKLLSILHIPQNSAWTFLNVHKKALTPLHRESLVKEMVSNHLFASIIVNILPKHVSAKAEHRAAIGFSLAVTMQYITQATLDSVVLAFLLQATMKPLHESRSADVANACLIILGQLSLHVSFSEEALSAILSGIASMTARVEPDNLLMSILLILKNQNSFQYLPDALADFLLALPGLPTVLVSCEQWISAPTFLQAMASSLCSRISSVQAYDALSTLFNFKSMSSDGIMALCSVIFHNWSKVGEEEQSKLLPLLRRSYQLFPEQLRRAADGAEAEADDMENGEIQRLIESIALPPSDERVGLHRDATVLTSSADPLLRARGARALLANEISADSLDGDNSTNIGVLVLSAMEDTHIDVLKSLYSDPEALVAAVGGAALFRRMEQLLGKNSRNMSVEALSLHVNFLSVIPKEGEKYDLCATLLFPHLLLTKAGYKRSTVVWTALLQPTMVTKDAAFLRGCSKILVGVDWKEMRGDQVAMAKFNERVVDMMSTNIIASARYEGAIDFLFTQARTIPFSASAALALQVLYKILNTINGARKLDLGIGLTELVTSVGLSALQTVEAKSVNENDIKGVDYARSVSKPEHHSTHGRLYAAILLLLPMLPRLSSPQMNWFSESATAEGRSVRFSRALYVLLNLSDAAPNLCTLALRGLFLSLQDDTLLLLASIWSDTSMLAGVRTAALKHAEAFIRALLSSQAETISKDLQVVLPFFVGAVYDANQNIRHAAVTCISLIASVRREEGAKAPEVYALKSLPEETSAKITFLDWQDFLRYTKALASHGEILKMDSAALINLHEDILHVDADDSGKESRYKRRILSYLLSHVAAWPSLSLRLALLASTNSVQEAGKLLLLSPLIQELSIGSTESLLVGLDQTQQQAYVNGLLSAFRYTEVSSISGPLSLVFSTFLELVRKALSEPEKAVALRGVPSTMQMILPALQTSQRLELSQLLLSMPEPAGKKRTIDLLATSLDDEETLISLLKQLRPVSSDEQPAKRARLEASVEPLSRLGKACQALSLSSAARSLAVLSALLDSLDATLDARGMEQAELAHIQQVIMTAVSHTSQFVPVQTGITKQLRIDVLVKLIKDSSNPQIVHQALLVVGALAQWSSDSLLHHLMPILLSTGSYVSPREDVYSARVAEKTIDSVIPVLTSHLRSKYTKRSGLQMAAKPYLDIFVDAAVAVPSHRRTSFFVHLISILGPSDFLNPVCILLLKPAASSDGNKKSHAEKTSLATAVMQARPLDARLIAIAELLEGIVTEASTLQSEEPTFLSSLRDDPMAVDMGHITVMIDMVHKTLQRSRGAAKLEGDESPQRILAALVRLSALENIRGPSERTEKLRQPLNSAITNALRLVSASTMLSTCLQLLHSDDVALQTELYHLLGSSLLDVKADARGLMSSDIVLMIKIVKETLAASQSTELSTAALKTLQAIAKTSHPTELSALTETVSVVTANLQLTRLAEPSMQTLHVLCSTLGPRIIPQLASVIERCCSLLQLPASSDKLLSTATSLLRHLLDSASSFWISASVEHVICTYALRSTTGKDRDRAALNSVGKYVARKLPTPVFVTGLAKAWKFINSKTCHSQGEKNAIFVLMRQGIKSADRALITAESRLLLTMMMEAWDGYTDMEEHAPQIKAFVELVIKLNEASFKPLYRIMFDWAWTAEDVSTVFSREHRAIAYCQAMGAIQGILKGLVTPYMAPLIGRAAEALDLWSQAPNTFPHIELWRKVLGLIKQSADVDDGAFWRDEFVGLIGPSLVRQIQVASNPQQPWMAPLLADTLSAIGKVAVDDGFIKGLNVELLMKTREDAARTRICALECVGKLWLTNGRRLAGWKHETLPFLHECAEDENEDVVTAARKLKGVLDQF